MKTILLSLLLVTLFARDKLEIHVFEVGQCDSQLIIYPSGYSILIDAGEEANSNSNENAKYIAKRIEELLGRKEVDVLVLSHHHVDHQGTLNKGGIWYLIEELGITFLKFIDRDIGTYDGEKYSDCNKDTIAWNNIGEYYSSSWVCYTTSSKEKTKLSAVREKAEICSTRQIFPPDEGAEVEILIRDAIGVKDEDGKAISGNHLGETLPPAENDYSIALRIKYGNFIYSTCGDLSGNKQTTDTFLYHDIETTVAPMMGEVDLYHMNHHGLGTSTNQKWVDTLKPTVSVVSCRIYAPNSGVMKRLTNAGSIVYVTNDCWKESGKTNDYSSKTHIFKEDIVIKVGKDDTTFTVSKKDGSSSKTYNIKANKTVGKCKKLE